MSTNAVSCKPGIATVVLILVQVNLTVAQDTDRSAAAVKQWFRIRCLERHGDRPREADINIPDLASCRSDDRDVNPGNVDDAILFDDIVSGEVDYRTPESPRPLLTKADVDTETASLIAIDIRDLETRGATSLRILLQRV